ncbi:MAG: MarR family transcriptional regulator [Anaerolineae bacterium]
MSALSDECAEEVFEVAPLIMRTIRQSMRAHSAHDLSVPQFRSLAYVGRHPGVSLSDVADHVGLTLSSVSKLVDGLVTRELVVREASAEDRRYLTLRLTPAGEALLDEARQATREDLARLLGALSPAEQARVMEAMGLLRGVFAVSLEKLV